jgi:hypothetical protein
MDAPECAKNGKLFSANPKADCRLAFNASLYIDGFGANDGLLALPSEGASGTEVLKVCCEPFIDVAQSQLSGRRLKEYCLPY